MSRSMAPLSLAALILVGSVSVASAAEVSRTDVQSAAGMCRAATTEYAAGVRNRPLGVANISSEDVYVTCAWQGDDSQSSVRGATLVAVQAANESSEQAQALDCTLVNGQASSGVAYATYTPKSVEIAPVAGAVLQWLPAEVANAGPTIKLPALSCRLSPGMSLQFMTRVYNENVGN